MEVALIERLARLRGIGDAYHDYRGELRHFTLDTKTAILAAMGVAVHDAQALAEQAAALENETERRLLPPLLVVRGTRVALDLNIRARDFGATIVWSVESDDGERRSGTTSSADCGEVWRGEVAGAWITRRSFELPFEVAAGYHTLEMKIGASVAERCLLICSPPQCYEPGAVTAGRKLWGLAVQLYTLRSRQNWGIGDFQDLQLLIRWVAARGAGFVGVNPLHALAPADPDRCSPYSASSRHFLNVLYIAVPAVAEFEACGAAQERLAEPHFASRLEALRRVEHVDYFGVAALKFEILELLHSDFRAHHVQGGGERARRFQAFIADGGELLQMHARFDALDRHFRATLQCHSGWMSWPEEYRDIQGKPAARFAAEHAADVEFFAYLQWLAHEQLLAAQTLARDLGMPIGIYGDYAVGVNPSGSEVWAERSSYCMQAEIGAPPDLLALRGQGWGIPPQDPATMRAQHLQGFARLIRHNMRYYGALRLDHVMSLFRLWWVAAGMPPTAGAYVHYPLHELLTVVALESARAACLVVGEDLGVVPDEIRRAMPEFGLYHYKVLLFEKRAGQFKLPDEYVNRALATVTTHDMPTLRSYWDGRDIELRRGLQLYPSAELEHEVVQERGSDRDALLTALASQGLRPATPGNAFEPFSADLAQAIHVYLARSNALLVAIQIEDLLGMVDPVNVPGTDREYPNWQRKICADLDELAARDDLTRQLAAIDQARR